MTACGGGDCGCGWGWGWGGGCGWATVAGGGAAAAAMGEALSCDGGGRVAPRWAWTRDRSSCRARRVLRWRFLTRAFSSSSWRIRLAIALMASTTSVSPPDFSVGGLCAGRPEGVWALLVVVVASPGSVGWGLIHCIFGRLCCSSLVERRRGRPFRRGGAGRKQLWAAPRSMQPPHGSPPSHWRPARPHGPHVGGTTNMNQACLLLWPRRKRLLFVGLVKLILPERSYSRWRERRVRQHQQ